MANKNIGAKLGQLDRALVHHHRTDQKRDQPDDAHGAQANHLRLMNHRDQPYPAGVQKRTEQAAPARLEPERRDQYIAGHGGILQRTAGFGEKSGVPKSAVLCIE